MRVQFISLNKGNHLFIKSNDNSFFLLLKGMPEYTDIPIIVISSCSQKDYNNLQELDPNIVYIEKSYLTEEKLLDEVDKKLAV